MASGKKLLSDSEALAYSRNRFAERSLTHAMRRLSDEEQVIQDRHQREILRWRDFRRQSIKTSGVWSTSLEDESSEGWPLSKESPGLDLDSQDADSAGGRSSGGLSRNCPCLNRQPRSSADTDSNELAHSLTFQSETVSKLPKPWAYTYSVTSCNSLYSDRTQPAEGQRKRQQFRRASSVATSSGSPDQLHVTLPRRRCSVDDARQDPLSGTTRPLTGRSRPGIALRSQSSRHMLSISASVDRTRPRTSVGLVSVTENQEKVTSEKKTNDHLLHYQQQTYQAATKSELRLHSSVQKDDPNHVPGGDYALDSLTSMTNNTPSSVRGKSPQLASGQSAFCVGENIEHGLIENTHFNRFQSEESSEPDLNSEPQTASEEAADACLGQTEATEIEDTNTAATHDGTDKENIDQFSSPLFNVLKGQDKETKVNIKLTSDDRKFDRRSSEIDSENKIAQYQSSPERKKVSPSSGDGFKRQETIPSLPAATADTATASPPTPRRPSSRSQSRNNGRLKSISHDRTTRRCSEVVVPRQRSDKMPDVSTLDRRGNGSLSRRYSAIDISSPGSLMKIVDQLEALQEFSHCRMIPINDDKEDWSENTVCRSSNEVNADVTHGQEEPAKHPLKRQSAGMTGVGRLTTNDKENVARSTHNPESHNALVSHVSNPSPNTRGQPPETSKTVVNKIANETQRTTCKQIHGSDKVQDVVKSLSNSDQTSDVTVFKGVNIHHYVRPQERHRADQFVSVRREQLVQRLSSNNPVWQGNTSEIKPAVICSKSSRQKVLQELVHRHNQPRSAADSGGVPPQLRARIDEFFKTIEPFCPKPDLQLN